MEQYILKSTLVADIKSRISDIEVSQKAGLIKKRDADKKILLFKSVLSLINNLEVKEVDLKKEIKLEYNPIDGLFFDEFKRIAKHFFELGLKVNQKGE